MQDGELFAAADVARLSERVYGVGVFVETEKGARGRIVAPVPAKGGMVTWWLVKLDGGKQLLEISEPLLRVRS